MVAFDHGRILDAKAGRLEGQEAVLEILGWSVGVFQFEVANGSGGGKVDGQAIELGKLLMEAAWLDDEIHRRDGLVAEGDCLRLIGNGIPTTPETLPDLPVESVRLAIGANADITMTDLLSLELGSKPRVVLSLVLLIEQGLVEAVEKNGAGDTTQPVIPAIYHLVDTLVERSPAASGQTLSFLYQEDAWESLFGVIRSIPAELLRVDRQALLKHLKERRRGAVRLAVGRHRLLLSLQPITLKALRQDPTLSTADAIVVWLPVTISESLLQECLDRVAGGSQMSTGLVVLPDGAPTSLPDTRTWTFSTSTPQGFSEVCQLLASGL